MAAYLTGLAALAGDVVAAAADVITNKSDLEKRLDEALSKASFGVTNTALRALAACTSHP